MVNFNLFFKKGNPLNMSFFLVRSLKRRRRRANAASVGALQASRTFDLMGSSHSFKPFVARSRIFRKACGKHKMTGTFGNRYSQAFCVGDQPSVFTVKGE